jgi:hypothetical protein
VSPPGRPGTGVLRSDQRGIIASSLLKIVLGLAVVGLIAIEAGTILFARLTVQDTAQRVADESTAVYEDTGSVESARDAAEERLSDLDDNAKIKRGGFVVTLDGRIRVVIRKRANTLVTQYIGFLEEYTVAQGAAIGNVPDDRPPV